MVNFKIKNKIIFAILISIIICCNVNKNPLSFQDNNANHFSGVILDSKSNLPIFGAIVQLKKNNKLDTTSIDGLFEFQHLTNQTDTVSIQFPGYQEFKGWINISHINYNEFHLSKVDYTDTGSYLLTGNNAGDEVFVIDTQKMTIIDTIHVDSYVYNIIATKDSKMIFVLTRNGTSKPGTVYLLDPSTKVKIPIHFGLADIYISPQETIFIISNNSNTGFYNVGIFDVNNHIFNFFDSLEIRNFGFNDQSLIFDPHRPLFYSINASEKLFAYNYIDKKIEKIYENTISAYRMTISANGNNILFSGGPVIELEHSSVVTYLGSNQNGSIIFSPQNNIVYLTDPGIFVPPEPIPSGTISFYNGTNYEFINSINLGYGRSTDKIVLDFNEKVAYSNSIASIYFLNLKSNEFTYELKFTPVNILLRSIALVPKTFTY